jgi:hypothetical protein
MRRILLAVLAVVIVGAVGARQEKSNPIIISDGECLGEGNTKCILDMPPKEWDGPGQHWETQCDETSHNCMYIGPAPDHHIACEDKSRFLLPSEDGKWHCLKLVP